MSTTTKPASREELRRERQRQAESKKTARATLMTAVADARGIPPSSDQDKVKVTIKGPIVETDVMTTREAAAYLKLSRQFLEGARHRGDGSGPDYLKWGRSVRYHRAQLDAWIAKSVHPADEPVG